MKDKFDDEAEKMAMLCAIGFHDDGSGCSHVTMTTLTTMRKHILSTIPLAELLRDKAIIDWLNTEYNYEKIHEIQPEVYDLRQAALSAITEEKK